ncbi:MAG: DUF1206 domain-containing protein [Solirubrobacteraceae bacterium]
MPQTAARKADQLEDSARGAKDSRAMTRAARAGLVAYGVVHLLIGWLALQLAFGHAEGTADNQGALRALAGTPLGRPLLWLVALGFVALVVWQLAEAALGHESADEPGRTGKRAVSAGKAIVYAAIGFSAAKIAAGGSSSGNGSKETLTAKLMEHPFGTVLVGIAGVAIVGGGLALAYIGASGRFERQLQAGAGSGHSGTAIIAMGRAGHLAKGVAFVVLGALFVAAALSHDPKKSGGLDDALKTLARQPYGHVLLSVVGLGIACFGLYCFARARYVRT